MRFSCSVPILRDRSHSDPYHQTFALALLAEELGFEEVTVGHHHFLPGNMADPFCPSLRRVIAECARHQNRADRCSPTRLHRGSCAFYREVT